MASATELTRLSSRAEFDALVASAKQRWADMWNGDKTVYTVSIGSCSVGKGAPTVLAELQQLITDENSIVRKTSCNGACWMEPWVEIKRPGAPPVIYQQIQPDEVASLLDGKLEDRAVAVRAEEAFGAIPSLNSLPFFKYQQRIVLADVGVIDPDSLEDALATDAYQAYAKVLFDLTDEEVIAVVTAANVRGRGGAGFPAGIKWESGRKARNQPKFVVCNSHDGGAYVCGEGSALMYSRMGLRGQPRTKPPRSVEERTWKLPTVAKNTETIA